jgi:transposase
MRPTPTETLRKRQQCHDLQAQGCTRREIQEAVNSRKETVRDWLSRPRPPRRAPPPLGKQTVFHVRRAQDRCSQAGAAAA